MRGRLFVPFAALLGFLLAALAPLRAHAADQKVLSELDRVLLGETTYQPETDYTPRLVVYPASITKTVELGQPITADTLQVTASTTQSAAYTVSPNAAWLSVLPGSGTAKTIASNHSVSYNTSLMATETTYNANITFSAPSASNPTVIVPVSIQVTAGLKLTAPTGTGVVWTQGQTYNVSWNVPNIGITESYFQILKGTTVLYTEAVHHYVSGSITASFKVPYTGYDPGSDYTVKATGLGTGGKVYSATSAPFTIQAPPVWMESPNGGESYFIGQTVTLKWRLNNSAAKTNGLATFYLVNKNDLSKVVAQFSSPYISNGMGAMNYTIPDVGVGGGQFLLKVSSNVTHNNGDANYEDVSDDYFTITDPVRVTSPNTGTELWYIDSPATVTWKTDTAGASVNLEIWDTSKTPSVKVADLGAGTGGTKTFTVPAVPYNRKAVYKIKAIRADNTAYTDLSDKAFTIVWPDVKVKSPNGGETFYINKPMNISWANEYKSRIGEPLVIKLTNGTTTWTLNGTGSYVNYGFNSYTAQVPANAPIGSNYRIKIESATNPKVYYDWSDAPFSIHAYPVQVVSPNGGERFFLGRTLPVHWKTNVADAGSEVYIELWRSGALLLSLGVDSSTAGDHTANFTIPDWIWIGEDFKVRVVSVTNTTLDDSSDGYFEVTAPAIDVLSPTGREVFITGKTSLFEWHVNLDMLGGKNYVKCELIPQSGGTARSLGTYDVVNAYSQPYMYGTYYWTIPTDLVAGSYKFRVTSVDFPSYYDESPAPFTIHDPPVAVLTPLQGDVVRAGTGYKYIHWKTYIPDAGTQVRLELWRPSGKVADLGTDVSGAGDRQYYATIPNVEAHDDYFIRAYSVSNPSLYGDSPWGTVTVNKMAVNKGFTIVAAPAKPQRLTAMGAANQINLEWVSNSEPSIVAYKVYRATSLTATAAQIGTTDHPYFTDSSILVKGLTYYYWVTAVNSYGQESVKSDPAWDNVGVVDLQMPDMRVAPGKLVYLHVYCPAASGILGNRLDVTVNYNKSIFTPKTYELTPLTKPFGIASGSAGVYWDNGSIALNSGIVRISPKNPGIDVPLSGDGRLFDIVFQVNANAPLGDYFFTFGTSTALYGPGTTPVALAVNVADTARVTVAAPVGAGLDASYSMGDVNGSGKVDYTDVNVAMTLISGTTPTMLQMLAGDVNADGVLDVADVQLIMLMAQGLSINAKPQVAAPKAAAPLAAGGVTTYTLTLPNDAAGDTNDTVSIPINANPATGLTGMMLDVNYDKTCLDCLGAVTTSLTSGFFISTDTTTAGKVKVNLVGTNGVTVPSGAIANLKFKIKGVPGDHSVLNIVNGSLIKGTGSNMVLIPSVTSGLATVDGAVTVVKRSAIGARRWVLFE